MSGPLIYVGTYTVKPGSEEQARGRLTELVDFVETNEPRLIAFNAYPGPRWQHGLHRPGPSGLRLDGVPHAGERQALRNRLRLA
jgi:hypothetical protein